MLGMFTDELYWLWDKSSEILDFLKKGILILGRYAKA
jgi:hypothetical protein